MLGAMAGMSHRCVTNSPQENIPIISVSFEDAAIIMILYI